MVEERRNGMVDLEGKLDDHIDHFEDFKEDILTVIAGPMDPLTKVRTGGMRGIQGQVLQSIERLEYQAANGGINTKWSFWQKITVLVVPLFVGGGFAIIQSLIDAE